MPVGKLITWVRKTKLRVGLVVLVALALVLVGAVATGVAGTPTVTGVDNEITGVNQTSTVIESDVHVRNPNPVGARFGGLTVDYAVAMNQITMATGTKSGVAVRSGRSTVPFTSRMSNARIPEWWVSHVNNGEETTLVVNADVHSKLVDRTFDAPKVTRPIQTDIISGFNSDETRAVNADQPLVSDPVLYVNETRATWGTATAERTPLQLEFTVYNPNPHPVAFTEIGYDITMNEVAVGDGASEREYVIPPGSSRTIQTTTYIDNDKLDEWWVTHVSQNQVTELRIDFYANVELAAGSSVRLPLDAMTYTRTIETDIFGTKDQQENHSE
ncbi:MAG: LEA type 2 family protein [Halobacteriota archaeon]